LRSRAALVLLALAALAGAADARTLRYGGDEAFAPFESLNAQGRPEGFHVELLQEVGRELGAEVDISLQPWPATVEAFRAGRVDLIAMVDTTSRRAYARFLKGHAAPTHSVYLRPGTVAPRALQDFQGVRLAVLDTEPMRESLARWLSGISESALRLPDSRAALLAVQRGEADMALLPSSYGDPLLPQMGGLVAGGTRFGLQTYAFAVKPGNDALRAELQAVLDRLEADGRLPALRARWLDAEPVSLQRQAMERKLQAQRRLSWLLAGGVALLLAGSALLLHRRNRVVARERTRRRTAERSLQQVQELLDRTFHRNPEPMLVVDHASGVVRDANEAVAALLGVGLDTLVGRPLRALDHHMSLDALKRMARAIDIHGLIDGLPVTLTRADATQRACLVSAERLELAGVTVVLCIVRDVSERLAQDAVFRLGYEQLCEETRQSEPVTVPPADGTAPADDRLREFTRAVAHDLRAPLLAIQGFVGLLRERLQMGHTAEALEYSEQVDKATRRMNAMIEALCSLAQIDQRPPVRLPIDMRALAEDTWRIVRAADPQRAIDMRFDVLPGAHGDPDLVAQVWQNLLHNAWKYSARNPEARVRVDSFTEGPCTWYRITDNGAGFDMAHARGLFQPFRRMHPKSQFEGSGIGLSMVQRIVRHHGGDVRLRSQAGVGTVAEFTLDPLPH
jgi:PAS domain S-box-containing protein